MHRPHHLALLAIGVFAALYPGGCAHRPPPQSAALQAAAPEDEPSRHQLAADLLAELAADVEPAAIAPPPQRLRLLVMPRPPLIPDTWVHALYVDPCDDRCWIAAIGGLAGQTRWLGPVEPNDPRLGRLRSLAQELGDPAPLLLPANLSSRQPSPHRERRMLPIGHDPVASR